MRVRGESWDRDDFGGDLRHKLPVRVDAARGRFRADRGEPKCVNTRLDSVRASALPSVRKSKPEFFARMAGPRHGWGRSIGAARGARFLRARLPGKGRASLLNDGVNPGRESRLEEWPQKTQETQMGDSSLLRFLSFFAATTLRQRHRELSTTSPPGCPSHCATLRTGT